MSKRMDHYERLFAVADCELAKVSEKPLRYADKLERYREKLEYDLDVEEAERKFTVRNSNTTFLTVCLYVDNRDLILPVLSGPAEQDGGSLWEVACRGRGRAGQGDGVVGQGSG